MTGDASPATVYGTNGARPAPVPLGWQYGAAIPSGMQDNVLIGKQIDKNTIPMRRLAVAFLGPTSALAQTADFYAWDELTEHWYKLNASAVTLTPGQISYLDVPVLSNPPASTTPFGGTGTNWVPPPGDSGSIAIMCVVATAAAMQPDGTYSFAMALDAANSKNP